jgi:hypothetical protein
MHFILAKINAINKLKLNVNWNQNESFKKLILNPKITKDEDKQVCVCQRQLILTLQSRNLPTKSRIIMIEKKIEVKLIMS